MKKIVLKLVLDDDKAKQKALKSVSTLSGIDFISVEMKEQKMTVIGTVDPVDVVSKLRKHWETHIISVGPAKEPEKKEEEPKKEEPKKEEEKKEEPKKEEENKEEPKKEELKKEEEPKKEEDQPKKEEDKKEEEKKKQPDPVLEMVRAYRAYNPHMRYYYTYGPSMEEDPNSCVIC